MLNYQRATNSTSGGDEVQDQDDVQIRDIHALIPPQPSPINRPRRRETWETSNHISSSLSMSSEGVLSENFTSVSREFSALVLAGSSIGNSGYDDDDNGTNIGNNLSRVGEEAEMTEEMNPLAIVPDNNPQPLPRHVSSTSTGSMVDGNHTDVSSVHRVKKEEVEAKIIAWKTAKIAKINNRFKREEAIINGRESEQVHKSTSWMKKVERKLEEKRARALEKMQNEVAKANRKAEEKRATAEAKRGTKVARILQVANLMKTVGRPPVKRSFF